MLHDNGLLNAAVKLDRITTLCFAAVVGFVIFMCPLCGLLFGVFRKYFTLLRLVSRDMQQACLYAPVILQIGETAFLVLLLPERNFSGLIRKAAYLPFFLTQLSELASALIIVLEGDITSYTCSVISILSYMSYDYLWVYISKYIPWRQDCFYHPFSTTLRRI